REEQRLVRIDRALARIESNVAECSGFFTADAVREVVGGASVRRDAPDVVFIVDQNVRIVFGPTGDAVRAGHRRCVVLFVVEVDLDVFGEVDGRAAADG